MLRPALLALLIVGCGPQAGVSLNPNAEVVCRAAGGHCVLGPHRNCNGTVGPHDCNPDRNPGGAFCCLPCPVGQSAADGGNVCG